VRHEASNNHSREAAVRSLNKLPLYGITAFGQVMPKKTDANTLNFAQKPHKQLKKI